MINLIGISGKMGNGKDTVANIIQVLVALENRKVKYNFKDIVDDFFVIGIDKSSWDQISKNSGWETKSFAAKLKEISSMLTGLPLETFKTQEGKQKVLDSMWDSYRCYYQEDIGIFLINGNTYEEALEQIEITFKDNPQWKQEAIDKIEHHKMTVREVLQLVGTDCMRDNLHQNVWINSLFADYKQIGVGTKVYKGHGDYEEEGSLEYPKWLIPDTRFLNEAKSIKDRGGIILRVNRQLESNTNSHPSETSLDEYNFDYVINNDGTLEDLIEETYKFLKHYQII